MTPLKIVRSGLCIGCGSCVAQSRSSAAGMAFDRYGMLRPVGVEDTPAFEQTCPFSSQSRNEDQIADAIFPDAPRHHPSTGRYLHAYVGAVTEEGYRTRGSSGGMVSWVLAELMRKGLIDGAAHVKPSKGPFFEYGISRSIDEIHGGAKSRYYPVEMSGILREIRATPGRYAVVGVPCFIKAVQLLRQHDPVLGERIAFTLGLFCGHMKSAAMLESFAQQMGVDPSAVVRAEFRIKDPSRPASTYTAELESGGEVHRKDWWNLAEGDWGSGFFQYEACNYCDDVVGETADISFGDAWVEPYSSDGRGTNVVLTRSSVVEALIRRGIEEGRLELSEVDAEFVHRTQAAGFRQRREGLAYRLTWPRLSPKPAKRVAPSADLPRRRKLIYLLRAHISKWSHVMFRYPRLYRWWSWRILGVYHGLAYSRGRLGEWIERAGVFGRGE